MSAVPAPLSFAQQRLWFLDRLEPGGLQYLVPWAWRLSGPLDLGLLADALRRVVDRHEILRTRFAELDGQPVQVVVDTVPVELPVIDAAAGQIDQVDQIVDELMKQPFDLAVAPLWRARVLRLSPDEHVVITVWHHVVIDAWSAGILLRELSAGYRAGLAGEEPDLPALDVQYGDYARRQRERLSGLALAEQLAYWRRNLAGSPPLELPADRPRGRTRSTAGAAVPFTVPAAVVKGLRALATAERVTLFMVLLAGVQVLLGRYADQEDVSVGTPLANRNQAETEPLIGFFLNTLVLRTDLSGDPTFAGLLRRVREVTLNAYDHEDLPFEQLVEALRPERDLARTPLFQVMFLVNNVRAAGWDLPGVRAEEYPLTIGLAKFDLTVAFLEGPEQLEGFVRFSTALYDRDRIERMCGHLGNLLAAVVADPAVRLSRLPVLGETERRQLVHDWNDTAVASPLPAGIHELVEARAAERPAAVAVLGSAEESLTYGELNTRANQLARHLRELGAGPENVVGVLLRPSVTTVVVLLGVLKAGAAYLALDPDQPVRRTGSMIDGAGAGFVVAERDTATGLPPGFGGRLVVLDDGRTRATIETMPGHDPGFPVHPDNLAYVMYTSGSTGAPKGVLATHRSVVSHLAFLHREYRIGQDDTAIALANPGFDSSVREIFGTLSSGARLVVPPPSAARDPAGVVELLKTTGVTVLPSVVPSLLYELAAVPVADGGPDAVRLVLCAGERLHAARLSGRGWLAGKVINQFGPTEATMTSTRQPLPATDGWTYRVGTPNANTRVYVLDRALAPCPVGVPGELLIGGTGVARGYAGRPGLTAERFVPDPFTPGERLYRTGDLCRWSADGVLEFLARTDHQVKVRGVRIEPGEVETRLLAHPAVAEAVVAARDSASGDHRLVAYVVFGGEQYAISELRAWLGQALPAQLIPAVFVFLDALPRLPNGKVDRRALPAAEPARASAGREFVAPRSPVEERVAEVWRGELGVGRIGVFEDFFELGGHSLLASRVVAKLTAAGVRVPLRALFEAPTIAGLAMRSADAAGAPAVPGLSALNAGLPAVTLYCVHDGAGEITGYRKLARLLEPDCLVVGVECDRSLAEAEHSISSLAAKYVERLRKHLPHGPYALCGWSLGGLIAYEMARRLARSGERAGPVFLIDAAVPAPESARQRQADRIFDELVTWWGRNGELDGASPDVVERLRDLGMGEEALKLGRTGFTDLLHRMALLRAAKRGYRPTPADLPVTVLRAADGYWPAEQFEQWRALAPRTEVIDLPGDHFSVLRSPDLQLVAARLRERLRG
ncbi:non-ribosomal peptide synthetase [Amycolatopsis nigrescens]|uniref:non-ribosomal peptide synthetase n=1 Tax=Amycolatopsis nigrescens TaxID=381445 RepID=UPI00037E2D96|nr:non-ribosomal peptide synthetase [Amycolatopsis nigrescens]